MLRIKTTVLVPDVKVKHTKTHMLAHETAVQPADF